MLSVQQEIQNLMTKLQACHGTQLPTTKLQVKCTARPHLAFMMSLIPSSLHLAQCVATLSPGYPNLGCFRPHAHCRQVGCRRYSKHMP